ncbi:glycosyltransferase [Dyadobacter sp. CY345]|uniref:glycosyltransferase family 2 protein n=1 Tax=Dyadobacter sp. CY345 TaxID=2909335 RepID=UPI001F39532F|nr:glycosyltransferase [Dyadobacter sp. CY345]MCF2447048.1 glycosyltransferase [Dyadobacter sp. CY345]
MSATPLISIVIPIYNLEQYIDRCINSLINITKTDVEIICINDGSVDNSIKILTSYADRSELLTVYNKSNEGVSKTRNYGIDIAKGKYIWFVDGDDTINTNSFDEIYTALVESNTDVLCLNYDSVNSKDLTASIPNLQCLPQGKFAIADFFNNIYNGKGMPWAFIIRRSLIVDNALYFDSKIRYYEDEQFIYKVLSHAEDIEISKAIIYHYLIRDGSALRAAKQEDRLRDAIQVYADLKDFSKSRSTEFRNFIDKRTSHTICWLFREASDKQIKEFYQFAINRNMLPVAVVGPLKTRIQAVILNFSLVLFRQFTKILR